MSVRSLNGLSGSNNIYINTLSATSPLEIPSSTDTSSTISIKGLSGFGSAGQVIKVNSGANGLEYGTESTSSNWVADGTDLKVIDETSYNFIELKRSDTGDVGLKLNNSSYESKLYIDSDNTVLKTANGKLKLENSSSYINNDSDRLIISSASGEIRVGNLTDFTSIFGTRTILNEDGRIIAYYDTSTNIIQFGNGVDTIKLSKGTLYQPKIDDASGNFTYNFVSGTLTASRNITLPVLTGNDTFVFESQSQTLTNKTLTSPIINNIKNSNSRNITNYSGTVLTIGNSTDLVEIFNSTLTGFKINDASADHQYIITSSELASNFNVILPTITATDTFCFTDVAQTLLNKTLTSPTITGTGNIAGTFTGNLTGNADTATKIASITNSNIVQLTGSQTLTDKTLTSPIILNIKNIYNRDIYSYNTTTGLLTVGGSTFDSVEIISDTLTVSGNIVASSDTDTVSTFGRAKVGYIGLTDYAGFSHIDKATTTGYALLQFSNGDTFLNSETNQDIFFKTGNTNRMTLLGSTGNFGINTFTPSEKLEVVGNIKLSGNVVASEDTNTISTFGRAKIGYVGWDDFAGFAHLDSANTTDYALLQYATGATYLNASSTDGIFFAINNQYKMKLVSSTGNFGINTLTPSEKLEVSGNIKLSGTVVASSDTDTVSTFGRAKIGSMGFTDYAGFSHIDKATTTGFAILQYTNGDTYVNCETSQNIFFNSGNVDKMRMVGSTGNFGINTTTPSEKLEVVGNIKATGILATQLISNNITFSPVDTGNNFAPVLFLEGNVPLGSTIGGGAINNGGVFRSFCFGVESNSGSFRALGLFANNTDSFSFTNGANYTFMGFFTPFSKTTAYSFTASHRCYSENNDLYNDDKIGLIVCSTGRYDSLYIDDIDVDNAIPIVEICSKKKSKCVLGVVGKYEKEGEDREGMNFGFVKVDEKDKNRLYINSIGEGAIWVCNANGNLENGDYIQSSSITGYGEKQDDDLLHNYSVAKITMDIDFNNIPNGFKTRTLDNDVIAVLCGCIYQQG